MFSGVDFKIKLLSVNGKKLKLTIWDTGNRLIDVAWNPLYGDVLLFTLQLDRRDLGC